MKNNTEQLEFTEVNGKRLLVCFDEPELSSDGGALVVREALEINGIIDQMAAAISDERNQAFVKHTLKELLAQRTTQICHGYEDANDCDTLRDDAAFKVAVGRNPNDAALASQPTMTRLENSVGLRDLIRLFYVFVDNFIDSFEKPPKSIIIDMDPTANVVYGDQQLSLFNAHIDEYCLMPFHVYDGCTGKLIATVIRPGKTPTHPEIIALLKRIVRCIRERFPETMIIFRADSHHTKPAVLDWLHDHDVKFVSGMATNPVLRREVAHMLPAMIDRQKQNWKTCRRYHSFTYAAKTWSRPCRIIARIEVTELGVDIRFIVTNLSAGATFLYDTVYCDRGNAELMIKEHKLFLKSSRTSCNSWMANQFRLCLHSAAYVVMHGLRSTLLKGTELATATFQTIQLRLLKVAARVERGKTFTRFHMPMLCPVSGLFAHLAAMTTELKT